MKEVYTKPVIEIVTFSVEDIITTSKNDDNWGELDEDIDSSTYDDNWGELDIDK